MVFLVMAGGWAGGAEGGRGASNELDGEIPMRQALVMRPGGRVGRSAVHTDALEALIVSGQWHGPVAGEAPAAGSGGERAWEEATADKDGWFASRGAGPAYAWWAVKSAA